MSLTCPVCHSPASVDTLIGRLQSVTWHSGRHVRTRTHTSLWQTIIHSKSAKLAKWDVRDTGERCVIHLTEYLPSSVFSVAEKVEIETDIEEYGVHWYPLMHGLMYVVRHNMRQRLVWTSLWVRHSQMSVWVSHPLSQGLMSAAERGNATRVWMTKCNIDHTVQEPREKAGYCEKWNCWGKLQQCSCTCRSVCVRVCMFLHQVITLIKVDVGGK